jgi:hypothetical protein
MARLRASLEGKEGKRGAATKTRAVAKKPAKTSKRKSRHAA